MSENSGIKSLVIVSAVFIAGILGGAGYAGFLELQKRLDALQAQTQRVVVDLGTELIGEIEKSQLKAAEPQADSGKDQREIRETLAQLRTAVETLSDRQAAINETLAKDSPAEQVQSEKRTVYFEMAKVDGEDVDVQINVALIDLSQYASRPDCMAEVNGYADTLGRDSANLALSRERARYVASKVRDAGIKVASVEAWGERRLETHTFDGVDLQNNRRVEIEITCDGPGSPPTQATS